ncbi:SMC family ATPase [Candidatus Woesearchaeota archaeon]|nr:SMC family ATPase [Candidatus Woesearchaeota archaeon]
MIIRRVRLNNIRSYLNQEILFPEGSTLLAGDIGSGKSTILLAIEFALFGAKKTDLPAHTLLRHGKNEGSVELKFNLDNKEIIIHRNLKRGKNGISQESGYMIIDGVKKEGTHVELKTIMLDLLGYPKDLVSRSKDLVYRYTVYTPQEEMKRILQEKKEDRLDTLRKVFNIDKYKRVRENTSVFVRSLKEKRKEYEGNIAGLEEKQNSKKERENETREITIKINVLIPKLEEIKNKVKEKRESIKNIENKIEELNKLKREMDINELSLRNKLEQRERNKAEEEKLDKDVKTLEGELGKKREIDPEDLKKNISLNENQISLMERKIKETNNKITELNLEIRKSKEIKGKVLSLSKCPTCQQDVSKEHKDFIMNKESTNLIKLEENIVVYSGEENLANGKLKALKEKLDELKKEESSFDLINLKLKNIYDKKKEIENLNNLQEEIKKGIGKINVEKIELNKKMEDFKGIKEGYNQAKEEFDTMLVNEKNLELENLAMEKEKEGIQKLISTLEEDINHKLKIKEKLTYISQLQNWLESYFINLMANIEKHVMLKVYREFNDLFMQWFSIMIEDEGISVRLDEEFTPVIEQNGYETFFENLSGGEKTSVALSYRLALNKVINNVVGNIKTKDIIMLDEPTDGFSTEQLDKIRDVLDLLNMKQVVVVSHEDKIETFVDNVIRVTKEEHISSVV